MSRNIRIKIPRTPVKIAKRRLSDSSDSSSLNLSDDDGYSGVEDVSESDEDDEEHVYAAEEDHIINDALKKQAPPRPVEDSDDADEEDGNEEDDDEEEDAEDNDDDDADEHESWDGIMTDPEENLVEQPTSYFDRETAEVEKHVRFTGVPDSDSESTTTEDEVNDFFPDLFVAVNSLDPTFRKEIENDDNSSNSGSFWDFHNGSQEFYEVDSDNEKIAHFSEDTTPTVTPMPSQPPTEVSTPVALFQNGSDLDDLDELDGYESDGETTEEEDISEPLIRRKLIRRPQSVELSSGSETGGATPSRPGKPHTGKFELDTDSKPMAVLNPVTRKMMIFTPQRNNRLDLSPESFNLALPPPNLVGCSPMLPHPGYLGMGAMLSYHTYGDFMNTQPFGPAEAFFPMTSNAPSEDSEYSEAEEDEEESKLEIEDFITFHHDSSDGEDEAAADDYFGDAASPTRPTTAASGAGAAADVDAPGDIHPLMSHFSNIPNAVSAFRRNQISQLTLSKKMSEESREFGSLYSDGPVCGVKSTCLEAVNAHLTPGRKKKRSNTVAGFADTSPAPLSQKRKASNYMEATHKRHRSISDMETMRI